MIFARPDYAPLYAPTIQQFRRTGAAVKKAALIAS
jgi:hypothetical protein